MTPPLLVDEPARQVRQLTLNRPDQLNAMTSELCEALHVELRRIAADRSTRAVILTGAGRGFCAGVDLRGYGAAPGNDGSDEPRDRLANQEHMSRLVLELRALPQPVIAAVNGPAAGFGLALALGCDIRYAASEAVFRAAFINIGVSNCDMGTSWLLPPDRRLALARADAHRAQGRRRGGAADRPGGRCRRPRAANRASASGRRTDRLAGALGRAPDQAGHVDGARDPLRAGGRRVRGPPADHGHVRQGGARGRRRLRSWTKRTTVAPSPTAVAQRLIDPARTSPAA